MRVAIIGAGHAGSKPPRRPSSNERPDFPVTPYAAWMAFAIAVGFFLFEFVVRVEPSVAAGEIRASFGLTSRRFGVLASVFFWFYAPMQIVVGMLLDRFSARRLLIPAILGCATGVFFFAGADNLVLAVLGRALAGTGASFAFVAALWIINHWFAPGRFALLSGAVNGLGMLGTAMSTVGLTALTITYGWRIVFWCLAACLWLRDPPKPICDPVVATTESILKGLGRVVRSPRIWVISIAGMLFYMPVSVYGGLWGTGELIIDHHLSPLAAASTASMTFWGLAGGSVAGGWLSDRLNHRRLLAVAGALLTSLAYAAVIYLPLSAAALAVWLFAAGFFGGFQMLTFAMAKEGEPTCHAGTVLAFVNMIGIAGALVFQPLIGWVLDATSANFGIALIPVPAGTALSAALMLLVREGRHPDHLGTPAF
jgi:MFS family permease